MITINAYQILGVLIGATIGTVLGLFIGDITWKLWLKWKYRK